MNAAIATGRAAVLEDLKVPVLVESFQNTQWMDLNVSCVFKIFEVAGGQRTPRTQLKC